MLKKPEQPALVSKPTWRDRKTKIHGDPAAGGDDGNLFGEDAFKSSGPTRKIIEEENDSNTLSNKVTNMFGGDDGIEFKPKEESQPI